MAYGEPRLTNDIDIVAQLEAAHVEGLLAAFPPGEYYIDEETVRHATARRTQFNIIHPESGLKVDIIVPKGTPFDESRFRRACWIRTAESFSARFAAPEDIIIMKMRYFKEGRSEKHLRDISGILKISPGLVDRSYIAEWARRLDLEEIWQAILARVDKL
jgi:hypothetical protein